MKVTNTLISLAILLLSGCGSPAKNTFMLNVNAGDYDREDCVVSADVSALGTESVVLYELIGGKEQQTDCQLDDKGILYWVLNGKTRSGVSRTFIAKRVKQQKPETGGSMRTIDNGKALILKKGNTGVLQYNYVMAYPPEGVDRS